ncbi:MAG: hypothetical protein ACPG1C_13910 [Alphaproteobacteria bacterium]
MMQDQELEALLKQAPKQQPSAALYGSLLEQMTGPRPFGWRDFMHALWPFGPAWQPAGAFVALAVMGFVLSPSLNPTNTADEFELANADFSRLVLGSETYLDEGTM